MYMPKAPNACLGRAMTLSSVLTISSLMTTVAHAANLSPSEAVFKIEQTSAQALLQQAQLFAKQTNQYCQNDQVSLGSLRQQWHQTANAWMALQGQAKGPEKAVSLGWSMQFWPDKKDITGQKMAQLSKMPALWRVEELSKQSVTVQSIGGLEWLLFDKNSSFAQGDKAWCELAQAMTENYAQNAESIARAWQTNPWESNTQVLWQSQYIGLLNNQIDYTIQKLKRPMGKIGHPKPYFAESWRSQTSLSHIKANLQAMRTLYLADGKQGLDNLLRLQGDNELADRITRHFDEAIETWPEQASLFERLQNREGYQTILSQYNKLEYLQYLLQQEAAVALGVVVGFNSTDGD